MIHFNFRLVLFLVVIVLSANKQVFAQIYPWNSTKTNYSGFKNNQGDILLKKKDVKPMLEQINDSTFLLALAYREFEKKQPADFYVYSGGSITHIVDSAILVQPLTLKWNLNYPDKEKPIVFLSLFYNSFSLINQEGKVLCTYPCDYRYFNYEELYFNHSKKEDEFPGTIFIQSEKNKGHIRYISLKGEKLFEADSVIKVQQVDHGIFYTQEFSEKSKKFTLRDIQGSIKVSDFYDNFEVIEKENYKYFQLQFNDNSTLIREDGLVLFKDKEGELVHDKKLFGLIKDSIINVHGYIDEKKITPFRILSDHGLNHYQKRDLIILKEYENISIYNHLSGNWVLKDIDELLINEKSIYVKKGPKSGVLDYQGNWIKPMRKKWNITYANGFYTICKNKKRCYAINEDGKKSDVKFINGKAKYWNGSFYITKPNMEKSYYLLYNSQGKMLHKKKLHYPYWSEKGLYLDDRRLIIPFKGGADTILKNHYYSYDDNVNFITTRFPDNKIGIYSTKKQKVIHKIDSFVKTNSFRNIIEEYGVIPFKNNGKIGFMKKDGEITVTPVYKSYNDYIITTSGKVYCKMKMPSGKEAIQNPIDSNEYVIYDEIKNIWFLNQHDNPFLISKSDNKYALIDKNLKKIYPYQNLKLSFFYDDNSPPLYIDDSECIIAKKAVRAEDKNPTKALWGVDGKIKLDLLPYEQYFFNDILRTENSIRNIPFPYRNNLNYDNDSLLFGYKGGGFNINIKNPLAKSIGKNLYSENFLVDKFWNHNHLLHWSSDGIFIFNKNGEIVKTIEHEQAGYEGLRGIALSIQTDEYRLKLKIDGDWFYLIDGKWVEAD